MTEVSNQKLDVGKSHALSTRLLALGFLGTVLLGLSVSAEAQQPTKMPRIGFLAGPSVSAQLSRTEAFQQGLRELGYVEGKNILIEWRNADGKLDSLTALAAELVKLKVDIIVTGGASATRAAKELTATIPIVMANDPDPIGAGFIASLARPGGNITGLSNLAPEISGKRLEFLKEILPKLSRVAVLRTSSNPANDPLQKETELAARAFALKLHYLDVADSKDIGNAFQAATKVRAEAILVLQSGVLNSKRKQTTDFAVKSRLPVMYPTPEWVEDGGLLVYSANSPDLSRRAATYVDKILKGAKPADLPVEQPKKFEFIINLKAAQQIGLTIPPNVLARADKVIK